MWINLTSGFKMSNMEIQQIVTFVQEGVINKDVTVISILASIFVLLLTIRK